MTRGPSIKRRGGDSPQYINPRFRRPSLKTTFGAETSGKQGISQRDAFEL